MQRCAHYAPQPQTQITTAATADLHILLRGPPEAPNTFAMRRASIRRPIRTQCKGDPQLGQHAKGGEGTGIFGPETPEKARPAAAAAISTQPRKRLAEADTPNHAPNPGEAQHHSQVVVLASIDLCSQHGRLVSARFNASVRKGVQGSCNRPATQAAGRAYRIVLQRSRSRRGGEPWFERPSRAEIL